MVEVWPCMDAHCRACHCVVAGFVTLWLAMSRPDPVVAEDYYRRGVEINKTLAQPEQSLAPAIAGRNHAATPAEDQPRSR